MKRKTLVLLALLLLTAVWYAPGRNAPAYWRAFNQTGEQFSIPTVQQSGFMAEHDMSLLVKINTWGLRHKIKHPEVIIGFILFLLTGVAVWLLGGVLFAGRLWLQAAVTALFLWHPLMTEAVFYTAARGALAGGLWGITALWLYVRGRRATKLAWLWITGAGLLTVLAFYCHPAMLIIPVLALAYEAFFAAGQRWLRLALLTASLILTIMYGYMAPEERGPQALVSGLGLQGWLLLWPLNQSIMHYAVGQLYTVIGAVLLAGFLGGAFYIKKAPIIAWGLFSFVALLVARTAFGPAQCPGAEHLLFPAWLGLAVALVAAVDLLPGRNYRYLLLLPLIFWAGQTALRSGVWEQQTRLRAAATKTYPQQAEAWQACALAWGGAGSLNMAIFNIKQALELEKKPVYYFELGSMFAMQDSLVRAVDYYRQGLALDPGNKQILLNLAAVQSDMGNGPAAQYYWQQLVKLYPNTQEAWYLLGNSYMQQSNYTAGKECFETAVRLDPQARSYWLALGDAAGKLEDTDTVGRAMEKVLEMDPRNSAAYFQWGSALARAGRLTEAEHVYLRGVERLPNEYTEWENLAMVQHLLGKKQEATTAYEKALQLGCRRASFYKSYMDLLKQTGDTRRLAQIDSLYKKQQDKESRTPAKLYPDWLK